MQRKRRGLGVLAAGAAVTLALAGAAVAALTAGGSTHAKRVTVTEKEWKIVVSPAKLQAGTTTFVVHNSGKLAHALEIAGAGMKTVRVPTLGPGASRTVTAKLAGGTIKLWCPVPGHAAEGMTLSLTVHGATSSSSGASPGAPSGGTTSGDSSTTGGEAWG